MDEEKAVFYAVRNSDGQFFRAKGYGGGGSTWVDTIEQAKVYPRIGPARGRVTFFATNYPGYPTPKIVKLVVTRVEEIDESERVRKSQERKEKRKMEAELRHREYELRLAEREVRDAQAKLDRLKNVQN
jgi:hypothetical protein